MYQLNHNDNKHACLLCVDKTPRKKGVAGVVVCALGVDKGNSVSESTCYDAVSVARRTHAWFVIATHVRAFVSSRGGWMLFTQARTGEKKMFAFADLFF